MESSSNSRPRLTSESISIPSSTMNRTTLQRIESSVRVSILLLFLSLSVHRSLSADYIPTEKIFLNCGGDPESVDAEGLKWTSDIKSKFAAADTTSATSAPATQDPSVPSIPYMSARVFRSAFTYKFPVVAGRKLVRLHFYPSSYANLTASAAVFSVSTPGFTLLKNFSVSQTADALNFAYVIKEYSVNVAGDSLDITFAPSTTTPGSYAFVNGIQIVSVPDIYSSTDGTTMVVGTSTAFTIDNSTAIENLYRLNVGGSDIASSDDTGLFRSWYDDSAYIYGAGFGVTAALPPNQTVHYPAALPAYVAPADVYSTARTMGPDGNVNVNYNLTWILAVDAGFSYLVRLHFCEVGPGVDKVNQRVFSIFIGNQTAEASADVVAWAGGEGVAMYKDYVVFVPDGVGQQDLWLELHPNTETKPQWYDSILNGVEIFKISDSDGNLAGPNPIPAPKQQIQEQEQEHGQPDGSGPNKAGIAGGVSVGIFVLIVAALFLLLAWRRRKYGKLSGSSDWLPISLYGNSHTAMSGKTTTGSQTSSLPANLCRHFSFAEIKAATKNFNDNLVIGVGGFGKVYRGEIDGGTKVAIKRGNPLSDQGVNEFQTEIELLSKLRHRHLVSLIGYCEENSEMILVYDYMANGTLREHLYKTENPPLTWRQRLEIAIGGARGLHYLHTGAKYTIIHRDVKTTNILVDEKWVAKVSDFGLSKTGPTLDHTHVSTVVKGSFGYLDPEYFRRQQLTEKSDVYSFGVVLFEILCARPALNPSLPKEQVSLAEWGPHCYRKGMLDQIIDPLLKGRISPECLKKFAETAVKCLSDQGIERPSMGDVLWNLEFALQLQESAEVDGKGFDGMADIGDVGFNKGKKDNNTTYDVTDSSISMSIGGRSVASEDSEGMGPSVVFSQIIDPKGR